MLIQADPDAVLVCPNPECKLRYTWIYDAMEYITVNRGKPAEKVPYGKSVKVYDEDFQDDILYCSCGQMLGLTHSPDLENGQAYIYWNVKE